MIAPTMVLLNIKKKTRKDKRETNNRNCFSHSQIRFLFFLFFRFNSNRHLRLFFSLSSLCACLPLRLNGLWLAQGAHDYLQTVSDNRHPAVARPCPRVHAHCRIVTMVCFATTHTHFFSLCACHTSLSTTKQRHHCSKNTGLTVHWWSSVAPTSLTDFHDPISGSAVDARQGSAANHHSGVESWSELLGHPVPTLRAQPPTHPPGTRRGTCGLHNAVRQKRRTRRQQQGDCQGKRCQRS